MQTILKKHLLIFSLQFICGSIFAQEVPAPKPEKAQQEEVLIYDIVDEPADFPGGRQALLKYLSDNIIYPESAQKKGIQGKCYFQFVITDSGKVTNIKLKKGVPDCPECDKEALRVIEKMPKWIPGKVGDKNVNSTFSLPIIFKL